MTTQFATKKDSAVGSLRDQILSGTLAPGTQLQQEVLAAALGLSATPIREALAVLETEGLVENRPHRGFVVAERTEVDVRDTYEIRRGLEEHVVERAAARMSDEGFSALERTLADAERASKKGDTYGFRAANAGFHEALADSCGSRIYADMTKLLVRRSLFIVPLSRKRMNEVLRDHRAITEALKKRDASAARTLMSRHLLRSVSFL